MEYEMNNGMTVEVGYFADSHDHKLVDLEEVTWRGINIMHVLTRDEINEVIDACFEYELDLAVCAAENRADMARDAAMGL